MVDEIKKDLVLILKEYQKTINDYFKKVKEGEKEDLLYAKNLNI
jgi:hypothetical protein